MTWYSSPEREVNWRWTTSWRSLLTSERVCDSMSQCMAVLFPVPVLATGGLSLAVIQLTTSPSRGLIMKTARRRFESLSLNQVSLKPRPSTRPRESATPA